MADDLFYSAAEILLDPSKAGKLKPKSAKAKEPAKKPSAKNNFGLKNALEQAEEKVAPFKKEQAQAKQTILNRNQAERGGKSRATEEAETPGTYNYEVQRARKILGITKGSQEDKDLMSAMWSAINQSPDDPQYFKRLDMAEAYKVIKEFQRAKTDPQAAQAVQERIQNARTSNERRANQNLPEIAPQTPEMVKAREWELAMQKRGPLSQPGGIGTPAEIQSFAADSQEKLKNLIQKVIPNEFAASIIAGTLHAPLNIPSNLSFAGRAGQELSQGNENFNALDVAGPVTEAGLSALGFATLPEQFATASAKIASALGKVGKLSPSTSNGFVAITKALSEEGVEDAYKVAKNLREAEQAGQLEEAVADIQKFVTSDEAKKFNEINQPKPDAEIPYRLDDRGKPIVRVAAEGNDVNVTQTPELTGNPGQSNPSEIPNSSQAVQQATELPTIPVKAPESPVATSETVAGPKPQATGLANQVQVREAIDSVIGQIDSVKGKSAEEWQKLGRESGVTGESASQLAQDIATGDAPVTGENIGKLLEGKRIKLNEIADLRAKAAQDPKKYAEKLFDAEAELQTYLENVQVGKGKWSDVGRALQAGTDLNYGNFEEVLVRAKATGKEVAENLKATLKKQSEDFAKAEADYQAKIAELQAEKAREAISTARRSARPAKVAAIKQERAELFDQFKNIRNTAGVGTKRTRGSATLITAEDIKVAKDQAILVKRIAESYIREGVVRLEDVVKRVQLAFKENLGVDIEDQAVIDSLATADEAPTKTEIGERLKSLKNEAKQLSTPKRERDAAKAKAAQDARAARAKIQAAEKRARQMAAEEKRHLAEAERAEKEVERLRLREQARQAAERARKDKQLADTLRKQAEKDFGEQWKREDRLFTINEQVDSLQKQLREGRYKIEQKKSVKAKALDDEIADALARKRVAKKQIDAAIRDQYRSRTEKVATGVLDAARASQLGGDVGILTRQGLFGLVRGKSALKGLINAGKSAFSETTLAKIENEIERAVINGRAVAPIREKAGLSLTTSMNHSEELAFARLLRKIPVLSDKISGSLERFQSAYINTVRADVFDQAVRKGFTPEELKLRAEFINNATGRGNVKKVPKLLQTIMTSPRYEASRWAMLYEPFKNAGKLGFDAFVNKRVNRAAVENMKDLAGTAAVVFSTFKLAELGGYEVNFDPTSSDFLKMRKGDEVWDISAGIAPRLRDTIRLVLSFGGPGWQNTYIDSLGKAAGRTLNPAIVTPTDIASRSFQRNALGRLPEDELQAYLKKKGRPETKRGSGVYKRDNKKGDPQKLASLSGFTVDEGEADGMLQMAPLIVQSFWQAYGEDGPKTASWAALREFIGGSVGRYPKSDNPTALEELFKELDNKRKKEKK